VQRLNQQLTERVNRYADDTAVYQCNRYHKALASSHCIDQYGTVAADLLVTSQYLESLQSSGRHCVLHVACTVNSCAGVLLLANSYNYSANICYHRSCSAILYL
jgi:hypothetical protein